MNISTKMPTNSSRWPGGLFPVIGLRTLNQISSQIFYQLQKVSGSVMAPPNGVRVYTLQKRDELIFKEDRSVELGNSQV